MRTLGEMLSETLNQVNENFAVNEVYAIIVILYRLKGNKLNYTITIMPIPNNVKDIQSYIENNRNKSNNEVNVLFVGACKHNDYKLTKLINNAHTVARQNIKRR